ncbi:adenosylcobinamide amidohydrolase [Nonomuraea sp. NPDC048916]|uniref:adenosylcobinamide amidohydrolase n=1 Tax=Nonomuraea sp. NPDC048916 TaxID=3154232 RepID=UPI0033F0668F
MKLSYRIEEGVRLGSLLWELGPGRRAISSAMLGGGIGPCSWVLNAQVVAGYSRTDPVEHLAAMAPPGVGVGMMTAASVDRYVVAEDHGARAVATVGLRVPTWAAAPEGVPDPELAPMLWTAPAEPVDPMDPAVFPDRRSVSPASPARADAPPVGTINIMVTLPVAMTDAALVNAVMTVTEAKTQALVEAGYPGTGTASDAVCVVVAAAGPEELFAGPRSTWGARLARAVHAAVRRGAEAWRPYDRESGNAGK